MSSTTVGLEAVAMPHTNICIAENVPHEQTQPLLDWGVARGFSTAAQLMEIIKSPIEPNEKTVEKRELLWNLNSKENIRLFFKEHISM